MAFSYQNRGQLGSRYIYIYTSWSTSWSGGDGSGAGLHPRSDQARSSRENPRTSRNGGSRCARKKREQHPDTTSLGLPCRTAFKTAKGGARGVNGSAYMAVPWSVRDPELDHREVRRAFATSFLRSAQAAEAVEAGECEPSVALGGRPAWAVASVVEKSGMLG